MSEDHGTLPAVAVHLDVSVRLLREHADDPDFPEPAAPGHGRNGRHGRQWRFADVQKWFEARNVETVSEPTVTTREIAEMLRVSQSSILQWAKRESFPAPIDPTASARRWPTAAVEGWYRENIGAPRGERCSKRRLSAKLHVSPKIINEAIAAAGLLPGPGNTWDAAAVMKALEARSHVVQTAVGERKARRALLVEGVSLQALSIRLGVSIDILDHASRHDASFPAPQQVTERSERLWRQDEVEKWWQHARRQHVSTMLAPLEVFPRDWMGGLGVKLEADRVVEGEAVSEVLARALDILEHVPPSALHSRVVNLGRWPLLTAGWDLYAEVSAVTRRDGCVTAVSGRVVGGQTSYGEIGDQATELHPDVWIVRQEATSGPALVWRLTRTDSIAGAEVSARLWRLVVGQWLVNERWALV